MEAIKIKTRLESETIRSPELRKLIGKRVEIIILEETEPNAASQSGNLAPQKRDHGNQ